MLKFIEMVNLCFPILITPLIPIIVLILKEFLIDNTLSDNKRIFTSLIFKPKFLKSVKTLV